MEEHTQNPAQQYLDSLRSRVESGSFYREPKKRLPAADPSDKGPKAKPADLNKRTHDWLRDQGYWAVRADSYNAYTQRTSDFLGIFDWIALGDGETVGVQHTTVANMSARRKKMLDAKGLEWVKRAGWKVLLVGWKKSPSGRWEARSEWV
jgi:hypothetical protein